METKIVNNEIYEALGDRWYKAKDDPVALLRAEAKVRNHWVLAHIQKNHSGNCAVLDIGCGAGFLSNALALAGHSVTGIDLSTSSLDIAKKYDSTSRVRYEIADATAIPYQDSTFDVVCAMDFLEHVEEPGKVIAEASRILKPGGLFFFHTFNRNPLSWLIVIKGVEWFVKNTPPNLHIYRLFIKPSELKTFCGQSGLQVEEVLGLRPHFFSWPFWKMIFTGTVSEEFRFQFTKSTLIGYTGVARKV